MCTAVCTHPPITTCSGTASDLCCPTSCNANTDSDCVPDCGNGVTEAGEECDDANGNDSDDCLATCKRAHCGDGVTHSSGTGPFEQCDDANSSNADDCVAGCKNHACGDGYRHTTGRLPIEECDDGNLSGGDACSGDCRNVEFPVATTGAAQIRPVAAVGSGGDVFIGWLDISGAYPVARGRLFASNGVPKGGEILLHAFTATGANGIDATADGSGSKLLVALDAGAPTVRARVLDFGGTFLDGGAITVKSYPNGEVSAPRATWVPGGDFFVAWRRTGALALNTSLEGAAVSMSGAAASFTLADPTLQNVAGTDVTPLMTNQIYAVWAQSGADIIGATFDVPLAAGGSPAMVNLVTAGNQNAVAAATNELGQRFVLWSDASGARDPDCGSSSCGIEARLLCPPPCAITELTVNSLTSKEQKVGDVGYGRGRFVTVFESAARGTAVAKDCIPSADCDVAMRLFNGTAPAVNPFSGSSEDMWVNQDTTAPKQRPRVAVGPEGTVVVVWESYAGGSSTIAARIFERLLP
jgi:cysteine-rich repeat protein